MEMQTGVFGMTRSTAMRAIPLLVAYVFFVAHCAIGLGQKSPLDDDSTSTPKLTAPPGVVIEQEVPYLDSGRNEKLDLYCPSDRPKGVLSPAVVIIHGGGWTGGDKAKRREFVTGTSLAKAGYVCVSVEYMKDAGRRWPTNLLDCKNGVRWLRKNADRLQIDTDHIGVIGGSAGGHLALMVAYTAAVRELEPDTPYPGMSDRVQACVDMYGPTNLLTRQATEKDGTPNGKLRETSLFSDSRTSNPALWRLASPVNHVTTGSPPTLIIHGTADTTVDRDQSKELAEKLTETGVKHELIMIPGAGHAFSLDDAKLPNDLRPAVLDFFDRYLKPGKAATPK
jgi:acetyl esterase/lipase